jgi:DNA-binding CsgD family transcriptional regulator
VSPLTEREAAVLRRLMKGDSAKEAAINLGLSPRTVEAHLARIKLKVGARNVSHMVTLALRNDLLRPFDRRKRELDLNYTGPERRGL